MKHILSSRSHPQTRTAGFTLVESLTVVAIILILVSASVFSLRGGGGAMNRHAAVGTLMGVFDQARMIAISDCRSTYVVFISQPNGQTQDTTAFPDNMWGQAYALFEDPILMDNMTAANAPSSNPLNLTQRSAWMFLPTGVAFKCDGTTPNTPPSVTATVPASDHPTKFPVRSKTGTGSTTPLALPFIRFDPTGQIVDYSGNLLDSTSASMRVLLFEGSASRSSVETYTHRAAINSTSGSKYAIDEIVFKPTTGKAEYTFNPLDNFAGTASGSTP